MPRPVYNPLTGKVEDLDKLKPTGYKYHYLMAIAQIEKMKNWIDIDNATVLTFDKDKWKLEEQEKYYVIIRKEEK